MSKYVAAAFAAVLLTGTAALAESDRTQVVGAPAVQAHAYAPETITYSADNGAPITLSLKAAQGYVAPQLSQTSDRFPATGE